MAIDISAAFPEQKEPAAAPSPVSPQVVVDPHIKSMLSDAFAAPERDPKPVTYGTSTPYDVNRTNVEAGVDDPWQSRGPSVPSVLPGRKEQLAYLQPSTYGNANLSGLADAPLANAYKLRKLANDRGLEVLFTSGARGGGGGSYHDRGEAVDARIQRRTKNGGLQDLMPQEEVQLGRELGKAAGWASMLDEIHYNVGGTSTGEHLHFSHGVERNLLHDPSHTLLNNRDVNDPNALKLHPEMKLAGKGGEKAGIPSMVETAAMAHNIDPDLAVRWIQAESGFDPNVTSPAGAHGLAQMMPGTVTEVAKEMGVSPDEYYTSPKMQVRMGLHYLEKQLKANNGNYAQAFAAYNAGPGGLADFKAGKPVYDETKNYVYRIMGDVDPTISDAHTAAQAIVSGGGRVYDEKKGLEQTRAQINNVRSEVGNFWNTMQQPSVWDDVKTAAGKSFSLDPNDPLSGFRQSAYLTNEFLNSASMGILPMLQSSLDTQHARDDMTSGESPLTKLLAGGGVGVAKLGGMLLGGSILLKGLRMFPAIGAAGSAASKSATALLGEGNPLLNALSSLSANPGAAGAMKMAGGPLALMFADTMEQMAVGGLQMGGYGFTDWMYNGPKDSGIGDGVKAFLANSMMGGAMGLLFGLGIPAATGLGLNALGNTVGKNAAGGSMAEVLGKYYQESGTMQRGLLRTGAGAVAGSMVGGLSDVTGVSDALFGKQVFADSASYGAMAALGAPLMARAINWSGVGKLVQAAPGFAAVKEMASNMVDKLSKAQVDALSEQAIDAMQHVHQLERRQNVWAHAATAEQLIAGGVEEAGAHADMSLKGVAGIQQQMQQASQMIQEQEKTHVALQQSHSVASAFLAAKDEVIQRDIALRARAGQETVEASKSTMAELLARVSGQAEADASHASPGAAGQANPAFFDKEMHLPSSPPKGPDTNGQDLAAMLKPVKAPKDVPGVEPPKPPSLSPELQAEFAKLQADKAQLEIAAKDKELQASVNVLNQSKQRLTMMKATAEAAMPELQERMAQMQLAADGHNITKRNLEAYKANLVDVMQKAQHPDDFNSTYGITAEGPWNGDSHSRRYLSPDLMKAAHSDNFNTMMDNFTRQTIMSGRNEGQLGVEAMRSLREKATADVIYMAGGDTAAMNFANHLAEMKDKIKEMPKSLAQISSKFSTGAVMKGTDIKETLDASLARWSNKEISKSKGAGRGLTLVDASTMYEGLLSRLEHADVQNLDRSARTRAAELTSLLKENTPVWYGGSDASYLTNLAIEAKAHLNLGEKYMPVLVDNDVKADFRKNVVKKAFVSKHLSAFERLNSEVEALDKLVNGTLKSSEIKPLLEEGLDPISGLPARIPVDPNLGPEGHFAQGAKPKEAFNIARSREYLAQRYAKIEQDLKGLPDDVTQGLSKIIQHGDYSLMPDDVRQWVGKGVTDMSTAPKGVRAWMDQLTMLHIEEVKRVRWLDDMVFGKGDGANVVTALREARVAGYNENNAPPEVKQLYRLVDEDLASTDATIIKQYNGFLSDMSKSDHMDFKSMFGIAQRGFMDLVKNRQGAAQNIHERMIVPTWEKSFKAFEEAQKKTLSAGEKEAFFREFADAVEDPGVMRKFKAKYEGSVDDLMHTHYAVQTMFERIRAQSPELANWAKACYFPHRWQRVNAYNQSAMDSGGSGFSASMMQEHRSKFETLATADKARAAVRDELKTKGLTEEGYLQTFDAARGKLWRYGDSPKADELWEALDPKERALSIKVSGEKALTLLADDPVLNPLDHYQMQLSSIWRADGMRQLMRTWSRTAIPLEGASPVAKNIIELLENKPETFSAIKDAKGKDVYKLMSEMPGFKHIKFEFEPGKTYGAEQIALHPEVYRFFSDFAGGNKTPQTTMGKAWNYVMNATRMNTLMGSFLPHHLQMQTINLAEFWRTPWQVANLMGAGKKIEMTGLDGAAAMAQAARHGLNLRGMEQGTKAMAASIVRDMGKEHASALYGIEDQGFMRFLQSIDPTDLNQKAAQEGLTGASRVASDMLGTGPHLDYLVNREALFKPIENGQLAGYYYRVAQYLKENAGEMAEMSGQERMRVAQMQAADMTNRISGAMPMAYTNNALRKVVMNTVLTPAWFLSKAYTIADGIDSMMFLGGKVASGGKIKTSILEKLTGRQAFGQYPPAIRDAVRGRMAKLIGGAMVGSLGMTAAAQYLIDGTWPWNHPPDKWFHLHHEGTYYTGPIFGYVRDILRFGSDMTTDDGVTVSTPGIERVLSSLQKGIGRQLMPPVEGIGKLLLDPAKRAQISEDKMGGLMDYAMGMFKNSSALPEMVGLDKNSAGMSDMWNKLTMGLRKDSMSTEDTRNKSLSASQYLMRQIGTYDSNDQTLKNLKGNIYDRHRDMESSATRQLTPYAEKIRAATNRGDTQGIFAAHKALMAQWATGYHVVDKDLKKLYPGETYRLSPKALDNFLGEYLGARSPYTGNLNTPMGRALMNTVHDNPDIFDANQE